MHSARSVLSVAAAFWLVALLAAGWPEASRAGEKIQFSGRGGPGKSTGLQPERKPAFAAPDFLISPRLGENPADNLAVPLAMPYQDSPANEKLNKRDERDRLKDWVFGDPDEREGREKALSQESLLKRLANDRDADESRPQTTMGRILMEQERSRRPSMGSNDVLKARSLTNFMERPTLSLAATNSLGAPRSAGGGFTNGFMPFRTDGGAMRLSGAATSGELMPRNALGAPSFQHRGAGFNTGFPDQAARMQEFRKLINPGGSGGSAGVTGGPSGGVPGGSGIAELPKLSSDRPGFEFGGSFSGAASGRSPVLNDLSSMRLGGPAQVAPDPKPAAPARRERVPTILEIPQRKF